MSLQVHHRSDAKGRDLAMVAAAFTVALNVPGPCPALAQGWEDRTSGGVTAHLYVPGGPNGSQRGLLVVLHGCSQSNTVLRDLGSFEGAAQDFDLVVALPAVPDGGVLLGCWDYYGSDHTRSNRHSGPVLDFVDGLLDDDELRIDPGRVAVAGLSSGAGMALVLACLAPDVFSGVAAVAGPAVGTDAMQILSVSVTADEARETCRSLAGDQADWFDSQRAVIVAGTGDFIVAQGYAPLNAEVFAGLYNSNGPLSASDLDVASLDGYEPRGQGTVWSDGTTQRIALILVDGMGHAWPAGSGPGGETSYVASEGPSLASFLGEFFGDGEAEAPDDRPHEEEGSDLVHDGGCRVAPSRSTRGNDIGLALLLGVIAAMVLRRGR